MAVGRLSAVACCSFGLLLACCGRQDEAPPAPGGAAPAGIIQELKSEQSVTTDVNARSPAFARTDFSGALVRTQDYIGRKVLLLDFWSVFCQSCLQEMPFLRELHRKYAPEGLEIVGVNTDFFPRERILSFMQKTKLELPYPLVHDRDQSLSRLFSVEALPVLVLIDSAGWIRMVHLGYRPADEKTIEARVRQACGRIKETIVTLQPVGGATAFTPPEKGRTILAPGSAVGDFTALDAAGNSLGFADWRGRSPAVVFFWSLFCQPCREEFNPLGRIAGREAPDGVKVLAVNVDSGKLRAQAARFLAGQGAGLTGVFDSELAGGRYEVAGRFGVTATPSTFLVDGDGTVRSSWSGEVDLPGLEQAIAALHARAGAASGGRR